MADQTGRRSDRPAERHVDPDTDDRASEDAVGFGAVPAEVLEQCSSLEEIAEWHEKFRRFLQGDRTVGIRRLWLPEDLWEELVVAVNELHDAIPGERPDRLAARKAAAKLWYGLGRRDAPAEVVIAVTRAIVVGYVAALRDMREDEGGVGL